MKDEIMLSDTFDDVYQEIDALIKQKKEHVKRIVNDAMVSLYWGIGKRLAEEITGINKPEYGKRVVLEISKRLSVDYGSGFDKPAISRMINFYQEFPDYEKVVTLSQLFTKYKYYFSTDQKRQPHTPHTTSCHMDRKNVPSAVNLQAGTSFSLK